MLRGVGEMLSADDRVRIAEAAAATEARTSAEIHCVLAQAASRYREIPVAYAAVAALMVPALAVLFGFAPATIARWLAASWTVAQAPVGSMLHVTFYIVLQGAVFGAVALLAGVPPILRWLTPGMIKRARVKRAALRHLAIVRFAVPEAPACVVIYVTHVERTVEIVADAAASAAVSPDVWTRAANVLSAALRRSEAAAGFVAAIALCGEALSTPFPAQRSNPNLVPDTVLEI